MDKLYCEANDQFMEEDYAQALKTYDELISLSQKEKSVEETKLAEYYFKRGLTHQKLENLKKASEDTLSCIALLEKSNQSSNLLTKAYYRKGLYEFKLDNFEEAHKYLVKAQERGSTEASLTSMLDKWQPKKNAASAPEVPEVQASVTIVPAKVRHEWYQTDSHVNVSVMIKKVQPDSVSVDFFPTEFALTVKQPTGSDFMFSIDPLCQEIDPASSSFTVLSTKIEIKLKKSVVGIKWVDLEAKESDLPAMVMPTANEEVKPSYPSSSRKPKNWDQLSKEAEKEDGKAEGDAALNSVFQQLYKDADDDTKRAMMKSYVESNGTALSTNWKEIGSKKTETLPPDGMVAKKWDI